MNKAKRLGVLALAGLVILSVLASTSIAYGAKTYYVRGPSGELTERVANIDTNTSPGLPSWRFPPGAETSHGWELNRGYSILDYVRASMNYSMYEWQSQQRDYRIFSPDNDTRGQVPATIPGWNDSSENSTIWDLGEWRIFR